MITSCTNLTGDHGVHQRDKQWGFVGGEEEEEEEKWRRGRKKKNNERN